LRADAEISKQQNTYLLITGASSGIGRATAIALSSDYQLILNGRDISRLEETREFCLESEKHLCWPYDLSNIDNLSEYLSSFLLANRASVEAFVHCAAQLEVLPLRSISLTQAQQAMNTNLLSAIEIVRLLTRKKINSDVLSRIVFISTTASQFGAKGFSLYCASKAGLDGLMRALAVELAPNVRVNSVLPGAVKTPMTQAMFDNPDLRDRLIRDYPLGIGEMQDIANAVDFLLSTKSRWITGQQFVVDGGRTINISA
jgi:NAD(P)-dependent dehydrogenase (short-subunit alcohol dehydrogenase family)